MLTVAIKDLKIRLGHLNLLLRKNAIWFKRLAQKREIGKHIVGVLYYQY